MARSTITIKANPQQVFDYVSDLTRHGEWSGHELRIEPIGAASPAVGARYVSYGKQLGQMLTDQLLVTDYDPPHRFGFESSGRGGTWRHTYEIEAANGGTRLVRRMEPKQLNPLLRFISPLFDIGLRRNQGDLLRLRNRLEAKG